MRFREDLYFRLSVVSLWLPPLRDRKDDIPLILEHFLDRGNFNRDRDANKKVKGFSSDAMEIIMSYDWPGNVRELHNVVERAVSFCEHDQVQPSDLPDHLLVSRAVGSSGMTRASGMPTALSSVSASLPFKDAKERLLESFEREYLIELLRKNNRNISQAAREAKIDRKSISRLLKKHGIKLAEV